MRTADFDYPLPPETVAQHARPRGTSRLLVLERKERAPRLARIDALPALLAPGDVLLLNQVRVIPARLHVRRPGGGVMELLLVRPAVGGAWEVMARPSKRLRPGLVLAVGRGVAVARERVAEGRWLVTFDPPLDDTTLEESGEVPLPPYIRRPEGPTVEDRRRYQTVYARDGRAVAAPTAGLHFTPGLLHDVLTRGVEVCHVTLHVGPGTFKPVQAEDPRDHHLDPEDYEISQEAAAQLNRARREGRRIICVGTTSCRTLEHAVAVGGGRVRAGSSQADTYIVPGYRFRATGGLLTNFHLPRSTLLMLVSALVGRERTLAAYRLALANSFRFYSYGDAMLVL